MRKIRVLVVLAVLAVASSMPVVVEAEVAPPSWRGGSVVEGVLGWIGGLWTVVAGSESGQAAEEDSGSPDGMTLDGSPMAIPADDAATQGDAFPEYDPDG